jgi:hypothetical protein
MKSVEMECGRKKKKEVNIKVGYNRAFMTSLIKGGNMKKKTHYDLKKTRAKEESRARSGIFE